MAVALTDATAAAALALAGAPSPSHRANNSDALTPAGPVRPEKPRTESAENKHGASTGGNRAELFPLGATMLAWLDAPVKESNTYKIQQQYLELYDAAVGQMRVVFDEHLASSEFSKLECRAKARALDAQLSAALLTVSQRLIELKAEVHDPRDAALPSVLSALVSTDLPGAFVEDQANEYNRRLRADPEFGALVALQGYPRDVLNRAEEKKLAEDTTHASRAFQDKFREFLDLDYESLPANTVSALYKWSTPAALHALKWQKEQQARAARSATQRKRGASPGGNGAELFPSGSSVLTSLEVLAEKSLAGRAQKQCPEFYDAAVGLIRAAFDEHLARSSSSKSEWRTNARALDAQVSAVLRGITLEKESRKPSGEARANVLWALVSADLPRAFVADQANEYHRRLGADPTFGALDTLQGYPHDVLVRAEELSKLAENTTQASQAFQASSPSSWTSTTRAWRKTPRPH